MHCLHTALRTLLILCAPRTIGALHLNWEIGIGVPNRIFELDHHLKLALRLGKSEEPRLPRTRK